MKQALRVSLAVLALAGAMIPAAAQYYYPDGRYYEPPPRYQPRPAPFGGVSPDYYGGGYRPAPRVAMSRRCYTEAGVCYGAPQRIGEWCKCSSGLYGRIDY
jgi:hypothetical protein